MESRDQVFFAADIPDRQRRSETELGYGLLEVPHFFRVNLAALARNFDLVDGNEVDFVGRRRILRGRLMFRRLFCLGFFGAMSQGVVPCFLSLLLCLFFVGRGIRSW